MMDAFVNLASGFSAAASPQNLMYCLIGCMLGTDRKSTRLNSSHT